MGCEQESPTGVHLDSEVGRVKRMHLCIEGSIKISYREIEMFHLPSHSIALITKLNVSNEHAKKLCQKLQNCLSEGFHWTLSP